MDRIDINTSLDGFTLLDSISAITGSSIAGRKNFSDSPLYLGIESLAQLGALHLRYITELKKHAFLLKINHCRTSNGQILTGDFQLDGNLVSQSKLAYSYSLKAFKDEQPVITGEFIFALTNYDDNFQKEILQTRYKELFATLGITANDIC